MSDSLNVKIILGSTRQNRFSETPATWIASLAKARGDMNVDVLDLRDYPMPFFEEAATPSSKKEPYKNEVVARWTAKIAEADAYVIIAPEYNHGYPAVLKNALDYVYQEWNNKPVAFISYGSALGARSVEQLREITVELQMAPIRNAIHMPYQVVMDLRAGKSAAEVFQPYEERGAALLEQLAWWGRALKAARNQ